MAWKPDFSTVVQVSPHEAKRFATRDRESVFDQFQLRERKGINKNGEFPVAVMRHLYTAQGYTVWFSGQAKLGDSTYLLTRMPGKRRGGDPAFQRMLDTFGPAAVATLEAAARQQRKRQGIRSAGGDPDLFVFHPRDPLVRFFVEVKLEDYSGRRVYRDELGKQQKCLFPLIEQHLGCPVRIARVQVVA